MKIRLLTIGIATLIGSLAPAWAEQPAQPEPTAVPSDYQVGAGDVLEVSVWQEEHLSKQVLVRPDGGITFPLVGELRAGGRTVEEIKVAVRERLAEFLAEPVVNVAVITVSQKIYVLGKVNKPGEFVTPHRIDVMQALAMAGGLTPFADKSDITVIRRQGDKSITFRFDYGDVSSGDAMEQNIILQRGDVVVAN